jgi:hypothetical protein
LTVGLSWDKVIGKEVKSSDNAEIGKIKSIGQYSVEIEEGVISKKHYFIPKKYLHQCTDDDLLLSSLTKDEIAKISKRFTSTRI